MRWNTINMCEYWAKILVRLDCRLLVHNRTKLPSISCVHQQMARQFWQSTNTEIKCVTTKKLNYPQVCALPYQIAVRNVRKTFYSRRAHSNWNNAISYHTWAPAVFWCILFTPIDDFSARRCTFWLAERHNRKDIEADSRPNNRPPSMLLGLAIYGDETNMLL